MTPLPFQTSRYVTDFLKPAVSRIHQHRQLGKQQLTIRTLLSEQTSRL